MRSALGVLLVLLAVGAVTYGLIREATRSRLADESRSTAGSVRPASAPADPAAPGDPSVTTVYYFHGDTRCDTCIAIETQASETVGSRFAQDIAAGRVQFRAVNLDTPENRHFRDDFDLSFGSVIVARGSRFENLGDVWTLVHDERPKFEAYIVDSVTRFMKASP
ncbi:MAG: nitrophenyl compound nitroreductase subunit ArsF family protein [Phycisphaerales bacterium]